MIQLPHSSHQIPKENEAGGTAQKARDFAQNAGDFAQNVVDAAQKAGGGGGRRCSWKFCHYFFHPEFIKIAKKLTIIKNIQRIIDNYLKIKYTFLQKLFERIFFQCFRYFVMNLTQSIHIICSINLPQLSVVLKMMDIVTYLMQHLCENYLISILVTDRVGQVQRWLCLSFFKPSD